jgi:hypothetical protein
LQQLQGRGGREGRDLHQELVGHFDLLGIMPGAAQEDFGEVGGRLEGEAVVLPVPDEVLFFFGEGAEDVWESERGRGKGKGKGEGGRGKGERGKGERWKRGKRGERGKIPKKKNTPLFKILKSPSFSPPVGSKMTHSSLSAPSFLPPRSKRWRERGL